ncbi:MAG: hypothetical protein ACI9Y1_003266 [Lentisphaeria bacterium]|jgi:hypothetical protein
MTPRVLASKFAKPEPYKPWRPSKMNTNILFVRLDTAKNNTEVACTEVGYTVKPVHHSKIQTNNKGIEL